MSRGFFIVFEGIDGSGKSTHINILSKELRQQGFNVLKTSEPSRGRVGKFIRRYSKSNRQRLPPETEALLFAADRFEHVQLIIEPALRRNRIVISDRFLHSSLAYQGAMGASLDWIREMNRFASKPDLGILLDIHPEYSLNRVNRRRTVFEDPDYLQKVRALYLEFVRQEELVKVDADRPKKIVQQEISSIVQAFLNTGCDKRT